MDLTKYNEFGGEPSGRTACRQLITAVAAGVLQRHAGDGQLTASTRVVSDDVMSRRELRAQSPSSVDDLRLVARRRVIVPATTAVLRG